VPEHREKLVLRPARRLRLGARVGLRRVELRALDRLLAAARDRREERALVDVEVCSPLNDSASTPAGSPPSTTGSAANASTRPISCALGNAPGATRS
jgi:hypothetical protein